MVIYIIGFITCIFIASMSAFNPERAEYFYVLAICCAILWNGEK